MNIVLHSYTFRNRPVEELMACAKRFGYDGVELQRVHFDEYNLAQELPRCIAATESAGTAIVCVDFVGDFLGDDEKVVEESVALVERNIITCAEHGIALMNGHAGVLMSDDPQDFGRNGSAMATETHYARAVEALKHLGKVAGEQGVLLTLEIHMNTLHDTIASLSRLLDQVASDHVMANPDPGNMYATPHAERGVDALDALAGRIGYFHFKNCTERDGEFNYSVGLADGDLNTADYLKKLRELRYTGPVCIEHVGELDPVKSAEADIVFLRRCMDALDET